MADVTLSYKGSDILELSASGSATLKTGGKYCEDDIAVEYVKPSGGDPYEMLLAVNNNTLTRVPAISGFTTVRESMFQGCFNLTSFDFSNITAIRASAFYGSKLTGDIVIPKAITMGNSALRENKITTATFIGGVNRFDVSAFMGNATLTGVDATMTSSISFIITAVIQCPNLKTLILRQNFVYPLGAKFHSTTGLIESDAKIYVPSALVDSYKSATNWSTYEDAFEAIEGSYYETHYINGMEITT